MQQQWTRRAWKADQPVSAGATGRSLARCYGLHREQRAWSESSSGTPSSLSHCATVDLPMAMPAEPATHGGSGGWRRQAAGGGSGRQSAVATSDSPSPAE